MDNFDFLFINNERGYKFSRTWLKANHSDFIIALDAFSQENSLDDIKFSAQLWHYIHSIKLVPKCTCGKDLKFISVNKGYSKFCSNKCSGNSKETREKCIATTKKKYGVDFYTQSQEYETKNRITNLNKYGIEHSAQSKEIKDKIRETNQIKYGHQSTFSNEHIKKKIKKTKLKKYGDPAYNNAQKRVKTLKNKYSNPVEVNKLITRQRKTNFERYGEEIANRNPIIKDKNINKTKEALLRKYGVDNSFSIKKIKDKIQARNYKYFKERYPDLEFKNYNFETKYHEIVCPNCGTYFINSSLLYTRYANKERICTNCYPISARTSFLEMELLEFIKNTYNGEIIANTKDIIGYELDIFLPEKNLAIEFDGLYWHNELYKNSDYHLIKSNLCKEKGIRLIHIFEDEWKYRQEVIKSRLISIIGLTANKIFARKCEIRDVGIIEKNNFLDLNHIQKSVKSSIHIGLYYQGNLVSLMCFLNNKNGNYNLVRFCNITNTNIIGGASRLFKHFIKRFSPSEVISFSDNRWSMGDIYVTLGFSFVHDIPPTYWYIIGDQRFHKFNFRKNRTVMRGYENKTEHEIMLEKKIYRIYDCGLKKWKYKKKGITN